MPKGRTESKEGAEGEGEGVSGNRSWEGGWVEGILDLGGASVLYLFAQREREGTRDKVARVSREGCGRRLLARVSKDLTVWLTR
jgi:hypothetical protein